MKYRYWYNAQTGEIIHRTQGNMITFDMPYLDLEQFDWANYTVDLETKQLKANPNKVPTNPRSILNE